MQDMSNKKRILVFAVLLTLVLIIVFLVIDNFFLKAKIEITTHDKGSLIKVARLSQNGLISDQSEIKKENANMRVRPGEYEIRVEKPDGQINEIIISAKRSSKSVVDTPPYSFAQKQVVINKEADSVFASNDVLRYQKSDDDYFYELLKNHYQPRRIGGDGIVQDSEWFNDGSSLYLDKYGSLHYFDATSEKSSLILEREGDWDEGDVIGYKDFSVDPDNNSFAVITIDSRILVFYGVQDKQPKDLGLVPSYIDEIKLKNNKIFIYSASETPDAQEEANSTSSIINVSTGAKADFQTPIFGASWSGDSKYFSYVTNTGLMTVIDTDNNNAIVKQVHSPVHFMFWRSGSEILYSDEEGLWKFDLSSGYSKRIIKATVNEYDITNAYSAPETNAIYITTRRNASNETGIYKIILEPNNSGGVEEIISISLPTQNNEYGIDVVHFGDKPTLLITTNAILNRDSQFPQYVSNTKTYRQKALDYLNSNGINSSEMNIIFSPADNELDNPGFSQNSEGVVD